MADAPEKARTLGDAAAECAASVEYDVRTRVQLQAANVEMDLDEWKMRRRSTQINSTHTETPCPLKHTSDERAVL